ncbi:hypothetical protein V2J09_000685 [Rumex salicifolius]
MIEQAMVESTGHAIPTKLSQTTTLPPSSQSNPFNSDAINSTNTSRQPPPSRKKSMRSRFDLQKVKKNHKIIY